MRKIAPLAVLLMTRIRLSTLLYQYIYVQSTQFFIRLQGTVFCMIEMSRIV